MTAILGLAVCFLASCGAGGAQGPAPPSEETVAQSGVTLSEVTQHPERYIGEEVTVTGTIRQVMSPDALVLTGGSVVGEPLLVLREDGVSDGSWQDDQELSPEVVVRATGTVRRFDRPKIEDHLGYPPDDALFDDYGGEATIVARRVAAATGGGATQGDPSVALRGPAMPEQSPPTHRMPRG